jgi:Ran GTPase-activating protein (RanGAP) involved in mRNA processing and transport
VDTLALSRVVELTELDISDCNLDDEQLSELWKSFPGQRYSLQVLNTSYNVGQVSSKVMRASLSQFLALKKLNISGNCRRRLSDPVLDLNTLSHWMLKEVNLSDLRVCRADILSFAFTLYGFC